LIGRSQDQGIDVVDHGDVLRDVALKLGQDATKDLGLVDLSAASLGGGEVDIQGNVQPKKQKETNRQRQDHFQQRVAISALRASRVHHRRSPNTTDSRVPRLGAEKFGRKQLKAPFRQSSRWWSP
jgi:hypothetical protein